MRRKVLRVGLDAMPYLIDHSFNPQPDGWPVLADLNAVVPATTMVQHMIDAVEEAAPGRRVVLVEDVSFKSWALVEPPRDMEITIRLVAPGRYTADFGYCARATLHTAAAYPAGAPSAWRHDPATERPTPLPVEEMYGKRLMFHGPAYRGVVSVHALGDRHIRGTLRTPAPPGALLDSGLQLTGNWTHVALTGRMTSFPVSFGAIRFFGTHPAPGTPVECVVRIRDVEEKTYSADIQYVADGRVWAVMTGCVARRFDSHPRSRAAETMPGRNAFAIRQPEGWVASFDYWPDPASQNSIVTLVFGADGYGEYDAQPIFGRKAWLLDRLAVKDAVRHHLWEREPGRPVFPIEVKVRDGADGRPEVCASWDRLRIPPLAISSARTRHLAVAIARPPDEGKPGIGVAEITDDSDEAREQARLAAVRDAAASAGGRVCQISHRELASPDGTSPDGTKPRRFVVAWT